MNTSRFQGILNRYINEASIQKRDYSIASRNIDCLSQLTASLDIQVRNMKTVVQLFLLLVISTLVTGYRLPELNDPGSAMYDPGSAMFDPGSAMYDSDYPRTILVAHKHSLFQRRLQASKEFQIVCFVV
ncbi:hypothetical protein ACROYT_G020467 [Oculina patagonica]